MDFCDAPHPDLPGAPRGRSDGEDSNSSDMDMDSSSSSSSSQNQSDEDEVSEASSERASSRKSSRSRLHLFQFRAEHAERACSGSFGWKRRGAHSFIPKNGEQEYLIEVQDSLNAAATRGEPSYRQELNSIQTDVLLYERLAQAHHQLVDLYQGDDPDVKARVEDSCFFDDKIEENAHSTLMDRSEHRISNTILKFERREGSANLIFFF